MVTDPVPAERVLAMTVGTGDREKIETTLIAPMLKSIVDGEWQRILLLPSKFSSDLAQQLSDRVADTALEIRELPKESQEHDADACFGHFDRVLGELVEQGHSKEHVVVDFTRGTKAMSAACVLAAVRHDIPKLRYVYSSEARDPRGMVVPGTEKVGEFPTGLITFRKRLDLATDLVRHGKFGAVDAVLPDIDSAFASIGTSEFREETQRLRSLAEFYAAWDCFDYRGAIGLLNRISKTEVAVRDQFQPDVDMRNFLELLAEEPNRSDMPVYAEWLRAIACDILANAERRLRDRHFEDVLVRAYRILELVGQCRLFSKGHDSADLSPEHPDIQAYRKYLRKKGKDQDFSSDRGKLCASRHRTASFLKWLRDPLARDLLDFDRQQEGISLTARNHSILIHGFSAKATHGGGDPEKIQSDLGSLLGKLKRLLSADDDSACQQLDVARRLDFSGSN